MNAFVETRSNQKGMIAAIAAVALMALFGFGALAIDVGYMMTTRAELQNAADAGALSAAHQLANTYATLGSIDRKNYVLTSGDKTLILNEAGKFTKQNKAAGVDILLKTTDLQYGTWSRSTGALTYVSTGVDAVRVTTRRDTSANGAVATLLGGVLGVDTFVASATSAAGLSGISEVPAGAGDFPVGISKHWFQGKDSPCQSPTEIQLYPTGSLAGCAGWHTFDSWPANAAKLRKILDDMKYGTFTSPQIIAGTTQFVFIGGTVATDFSNMQALYDKKKDASGQWLVHIPVYDSEDCSNPNDRITIVGFATARITQVLTAPDKLIKANVECGIMPMGKGNGTDYGTLAAAPSIIQ